MADRQENKKTVVVVDDEPIIRMDLGQMLEELNYEVVAEGADGFDAVELCRKKNPDVVLLDLEMPVFDGMTAAETISFTTRKTPRACKISASAPLLQMKTFWNRPAGSECPVIS